MFFYRDSSLSAFRFIILLLLFIFPIQGTQLRVDYKSFFAQEKIQKIITLHTEGHLVESMLPKSKHEKYKEYKKVTIDRFLENDLNWKNWEKVLKDNFPIGKNKNQRKQGTSYSMLPPRATKTKMELFHENHTSDRGVIGYLINIFEDENLNKNNASKDAISNLLQVPAPIKKHLKVAFLDDAINNKGLTETHIDIAYKYLKNHPKPSKNYLRENLVTIFPQEGEIYVHYYIPWANKTYYCHINSKKNNISQASVRHQLLSKNDNFIALLKELDNDYADNNGEHELYTDDGDENDYRLLPQIITDTMEATGINTPILFYIDVGLTIDDKVREKESSYIYKHIKDTVKNETAANAFWDITRSFRLKLGKLYRQYFGKCTPDLKPEPSKNRGVTSTLQTFSVWVKTRTAVREKEKDDDDDDTYDYNDHAKNNDTETPKKYIPYNEIKLYDSQDQDLLGFIFNQSDKLYLYQEDNNNKKTYPKGTNLEEVLSCLLILVLAQEKKYEETSKLLPVFRYHGANELTCLDIPAYYNELVEAKIIDETSAYGNLLKQALERLNKKINNKLVDNTQKNGKSNSIKNETQFTINGNIRDNNNASTSKHNKQTSTNNNDHENKIVENNNNLKTWSSVYELFTIMLVVFVSVLSYFYYFHKKK